MGKSLSAYLAQDRHHALGHDQSLPDRAQGSALFADISGFTSLTEKLTQQFGARRGIEELTIRINVVYDALIHIVEQNGGSVVSFAGDAITCWFGASEEPSSLRAVSAALAMQATTRPMMDISLKVAVTSGTARRFAVGDPQIQLLDTLAGATIARLAVAEHLTRMGEVVADAATVEACGDALQAQELRADLETNERFAVIASSPATLERVTANTLSEHVPSEILNAWVPPTVVAREQSGLGQFLTELRPAVALFLRFSGIDYDGDESAQEKLDALIRQIQHAVTHYDGALLQLTIGDKGSYIYVCFGAPTAHEDDARRAVRVAMVLSEIPRKLTFLQPMQVGISRGTMRVGAYGSATRRTYGALGDEVNIAARLMSNAAPGEILLSGRVQQLLGDHFTLEPRPPLPLKGKAEPMPVFAVTGVQRHRATRLLEPTYRLPMIGRRTELDVIANKLELTRQGQGQIIGITAEAGMGKSRLVAEAIRLANRHGFTGYGGACESSGTNTAYLAWKSIWQAFFDVDPIAPRRRQLRQLEGEIQDRAPERLQAMPLLAPLLDMQIDDNDFTHTVEPKDRRNVLEALLEDCVKAAVKEEPILFVLEDVHWIDPLSHDLLEALARVSVNLPVCFVLAYRPPELERLQAPRIEALPHFTKIVLNELTDADAEQLIRAKLAQLFPERNGGLPKALTGRITTQAEGNPFFIEELLNYLHDRGISPDDEQALTSLELPSSLHTLILSRIDQLTETQKVTLKVASIIGRLFSFAWLHGYYPTLGKSESVKADLNVLARLDITPLDTPEPELAYLFKHIVTQEVAYESLAFATRAQLHEQLAQFLEARDADKYLYLLAFHYGRSENVAKQCEYLRKAGEAAQAAYANEAALEYYERLLPLLSMPAEQIEIHLKHGTVLELLGNWEDAKAAYRSALGLAEQTADARAVASSQYALGWLSQLGGDFATALDWLARARTSWQALGEQVEAGRTLVGIGFVFERKGDYLPARQALSDGLAIARAAHDHGTVARALDGLGMVARDQGDYAEARALLEESLTLCRETGDKRGIARALHQFGFVACKQGDFTAAHRLFEESLTLDREMGHKLGIARMLNNLGYVTLAQGDYAAARALFEEGLTLRREMGDKRGIAIALLNLGDVALAQGDDAAARTLYEQSLRLYHDIGEKPGIMYNLIGFAGVAGAQHEDMPRAAQLAGAAEALRASIRMTLELVESDMYERIIAAAKEGLGEEAFNAAFEAGQSMTLEEAVQFALEENQSRG